MDLENLKEKIKQILPNSNNVYTLPFAVLLSNEFGSFSEIPEPVLQQNSTWITDYNKTHSTSLERKINQIINFLREEYNTLQDNISEKHFFQDVNSFISEILFVFYEETLDYELYLDADEEIIENPYPDDEEPIILSSVKVTGDLILALEEIWGIEDFL